MVPLACDGFRCSGSCQRLEGDTHDGFKNFILRGNLVELAVAFIMAVAFAAVVTATVA